MGTIDRKRLLLGGLLAGLVVNISEFVLNGVVLMDAMEAAMAGSGASFAPWAMPFYVVMAFLWGFGMTALYAAVRPRFGAGPATAIGVGAFFWLFVSVLPTFGVVAMGYDVGGGGVIATSLVWTLIELPLAATIGAWAYREVPTAAPAPAL